MKGEGLDVVRTIKCGDWRKGECFFLELHMDGTGEFIIKGG